jgi:hypothetical protein
VTRRSRQNALLLALLCGAACEPGKTHILGRLPEPDAGQPGPEPDAELEPEPTHETDPVHEEDAGPATEPDAQAADADVVSEIQVDATLVDAADTAASDAAQADADASPPEPDAAKTGDGALASCVDDYDCDTRERPYCSTELGRCVECTRDWQCQDDEYCRDSTGVCVERR